MEPYYTIMKLPGERGAEFIQMLPFTPRQKDNLAAWMVARSDGENYGKLAVFQFPKQKVVFGPRQVVARINQDQAISPQITLWNQQGSEVIQGTLLVIPIEESLIYIRPLYLRASGGQIPELKRVIVAYQNQIVMDETLTKALDRLFPADGSAPRRTPQLDAAAMASLMRPSDAATTTESTTGAGQDAGRPGAAAGSSALDSPEMRSLVQQAEAHYQRAMDAQRAGDWAQYGEQIRLLGRALADLRAAERREAPPR